MRLILENAGTEGNIAKLLTTVCNLFRNHSCTRELEGDKHTYNFKKH